MPGEQGKAALLGDLLSILLAPYDESAAFSGRIRVAEQWAKKLGDKPKSVKIILIATFTEENYGMNFNGYAKGSAVFAV